MVPKASVEQDALTVVPRPPSLCVKQARRPRETVRSVVASRAESSDTVSVTSKGPAAAYTCEAVGPVSASDPSPQFQENEVIVPGETSVEQDASTSSVRTA